METLGQILHELVSGATTIIDNRKGELHDLIDGVVESLTESLTKPADATSATPVTDAPADVPAGT